MNVRSGLAVVVLGSLVGVRASAQLPGESVYETRKDPRAEVRARAFEEVKPFLAEWSSLIAKRDRARLEKAMMDAVLFSPLGLSADGRATVADTLANWLPRVSGYHLTPIDFDASGNLAYAFGTLRYDRRAADGTSEAINAEWVMVLYLWGRTWKVRSYLERAAPGGM